MFLGMGILNKCFGGSVSTSSTKQPSATVEDLCHRFSLSQLRKSTDGFHKSRIITEGNFSPFSITYRACISINGHLKDVTVKRLRQEAAISSYGQISYRNNIILRCQLQHQNLVSIVGFCDDHNEMILVFDYPPNGSLYHQLHRAERKSPALSWKKRLEISIGVARGLHYLHSGTKRTIIHRDVKLDSIFLDENWVPKLKISGFSIKGPKFSKKDAKPIELGSVDGTFGYMAPEYILTAKVTHKVDVYSFGAALFALICGKPLHQIMRQLEIDYITEVRNLAATANVEGFFDESLIREIAPECWNLYMDLTDSCLSEDPNERPHMGDVEGQLERILQLQEEADSNQASHAFFI